MSKSGELRQKSLVEGGDIHHKCPKKPPKKLSIQLPDAYAGFADHLDQKLRPLLGERSVSSLVLNALLHLCRQHDVPFGPPPRYQQQALPFNAQPAPSDEIITAELMAKLKDPAYREVFNRLKFTEEGLKRLDPALAHFEGSANGASPQPKEEDLYYIQDSRSYVGNAVSWWCPGGKGYTCHIDGAGLYPRNEAERKERNRSTDHAWPRAVVEAAASRNVDFQRLPVRETVLPSDWMGSHKNTARSGGFGADEKNGAKNRDSQENKEAKNPNQGLRIMPQLRAGMTYAELGAIHLPDCACTAFGPTLIECESCIFIGAWTCDCGKAWVDHAARDGTAEGCASFSLKIAAEEEVPVQSAHSDNTIRDIPGQEFDPAENHPGEDFSTDPSPPEPPPLPPPLSSAAARFWSLLPSDDFASPDAPRSQADRAKVLSELKAWGVIVTNGKRGRGAKYKRAPVSHELLCAAGLSFGSVPIQS